MAVDDFFKKRISSKDGFWAMRKTNDDWEEIYL